jgi:hypothetical protein
MFYHELITHVHLRNLDPSFVVVAAEVDGRHLQIDCELLCIAGYRLTITATVLKGDTPFFLDIPYGIIQVDATQTLLKDPETGSQGVAPVLRLKIANDPQRQCDMNATKQKINEIKLFMLTDKGLNRCHQMLQHAIDKNATQLVHSSGAVLDASQYAESDSEDQEPQNKPGIVVDNDVQMDDAPHVDDTVPAGIHAERAREVDHQEPLPVPDTSGGREEHKNDVAPPETQPSEGNKRKPRCPKKKKALPVDVDEGPISSHLRSRNKPQPESARRVPLSSSKAARVQHGQEEVDQAKDLWDVPLSPQAAKKTLPKKALPRPTAKLPKTRAQVAAKKTKQDASKPKSSRPVRVSDKQIDAPVSAADAHQSLDRISETPQSKRNAGTACVPDIIVVKDPELLRVEDEHILRIDTKPEKRASRKTPLGSRNVWEALVSDAIDEEAPTKPRAYAAVDVIKTSIVTKNKNKSALSSNRGKAPTSSSRGIKKPEPPLVNERSTRKKGIVTFSKHGPRNQGRQPVHQTFGSPDPEDAEGVDMKDLPSSSLPIISAPQSSASRTAIKTGSSSGTLGHVDQVFSKATSSASKKRSLAGSSSATRRKKAKVAEPAIADDEDGFVPIEQYETAAFVEAANDEPKYAQRRMLTHITEEGTPLPREKTIEEDLIETAGVVIAKDAAESPVPEHTPPCVSSSPPVVRTAQEVDPFARADKQKRQPSAFAGRLAASATKKEQTDVLATMKASVVTKMPPSFNAMVTGEADEDCPEPVVHGNVEVHASHLRPAENAIAGEDDIEIDSDLSTDIDMDEIEARDKAAVAEWEAALQPRHRTLLASLTRISRQFIAHIVNREDAFTREIDRYFQEGLEIVEAMDKKHVAQLLEFKKGGHNHARHTDVVASLSEEYVKMRDEAVHRREAWQQMDKVRTLQLRQFRAEMEDNMEM